MASKQLKNALVLLLLIVILGSMPLFAGAPTGYVRPDYLEPSGKYKYGGTLRIARTADFDTLSPFTGTGASWSVTIVLYENLVALTPDWGIGPWLAYSWNVSADGLNYTFNLAPNATWSDGVPLTSEDVKFTFDTWRTQQMPRMLPYIKNVKSITTPDKYTVVFTLVSRDSTFIPRIIAWPACCIVPKHIWANITDWKTFTNDDPKLAVGSGPFMLKEWKKGEYVQLVANEKYWQGRPYLDGITHIVIQMRDMQLMAFEKGELDIFRGIYGNEVGRFLGPRYQIYQYVDPGLPQFYANNRRRPGNDTAFRMALAYSVDRSKMMDLAMYGYAKEPRHMLPPPYDVGGWIPPEKALPDYNLTKAADILDKAGYKDIDKDGWREYPNGDKMTLTLTQQDPPHFVKCGEILVNSLKSIGVNVNLEVLSGGMWSVKVISTHDIDLTYFRYGPGSNDPLEPLGWLTSWGDNWVGFYNSTYDELHLRATSTTDPQEKKQLVWQMERILAEQMPYAPPICFIYLVVVDNQKFDGWSNPLPYSTITNGQMFPYYNLHLRGLPPALNTTLTLAVPAKAYKNETVSLSATLKDQAGAPLQARYIDFYVAGIGAGSAKTGADGVAKYTWVPTAEGNITIRAGYAGASDYAASTSSTTTVSVGSPTPPAPPPPDYTPYYISIGIVIVVVVVAAIFVSRTKKA